ncbi:MAG TPA: polyprenyl synthetase family protein [Gammaproteobacteria bacterium]|nr:polyprenyl synthetase family protein [Gammaproteobacteria bacterium]
MTVDTAAQLLKATVDELSRRAPAVIAAAADQLRGIILGLHFGDGSRSELRADHSRLVVTGPNGETPHVEVYFDDRAMNLLFDLERKPVDQVWSQSLDVRGDRQQVLAVWRTFQVLSQRGSGLRAVQSLWRGYRDRNPQRWGQPAELPVDTRSRNPQHASNTGWHALDYLDHRYAQDIAKASSTVGGAVYTDARSLWDGYESKPWWQFADVVDTDLMETMQACKDRVSREFQRIVPDREPKAELYDLMREYPAREGKGLRPTLTIATCCALGGRDEDAVRAAAAVELFHNGFLVHDDIADESTHRRNEPTLHEAHGIGLAVNTGDAMNLLAVDAVLSNLPTLGLARTLGLIHEIMHMCRETVEGQAIELGWIRHLTVPKTDQDYFDMSTKKTGWYTCISPCRLGAICAGETDPGKLDLFTEAFRLIGIAFQIQDDVLNLLGDEVLYGKEPLGDLLEGKRTVMMIHLFREIAPKRRPRLLDIIRLSRTEKRFADAEEILAAMHEVGSIEYAVKVADRLAHEGVRRFEEDLAFVPENEAKALLRQIANYVTTRPL